MATFEEFVAARSPVLLRAGWLLTGDRHDAEELVQSALVKTCSKFDRIERSGDGSFEAYVRRAMHNEYVSWYRRRRRREHLSVDATERVVQDGGERAIARHLVLSALDELSPRQRQVIVLRFYEDMSLFDTASLLRCSLGAVKSHQARALTALREHPVMRDIVAGEHR